MPHYKDITTQKKYFDGIADDYGDGNIPMVDFLERLRKLTAPFVKGRVLDVGNGGLICFDTSKAQEITITDIVKKVLKKPRFVDSGKLWVVKGRLLKKIKSRQASAMDLPFKDNSFDTVVLFNVAHHLSVPTLNESRENVKCALSEIHRVLKKDGIFLMCEDCPFLPYKLVQDIFYRVIYAALYKFGKPLPYFMSRREIRNNLNSSGFRIKKETQVRLPKWVYQPLFPGFYPPGAIWDIVLGNRFFVSCKSQK